MKIKIGNENSVNLKFLQLKISSLNFSLAKKSAKGDFGAINKFLKGVSL